MDDPSHRAPPPPYPPGYPPHVQMHPAPGVSVQISNVVSYPQPYPYPQHPQHPQPYPQLQQQAQPPGVVDMMRADASNRAMEAVARRGPARVLSYAIGAGATLMLAFNLLLLAFGASAVAVFVAAIPLSAIAIVAFIVGGRSGRGVVSHHLEQAILDLASRNGGEVKVVALAQSTGRPLRECQMAIDAMVSQGHATVEADEAGVLVYRIPELSPTKVLVAHGETR